MRGLRNVLMGKILGQNACVLTKYWRHTEVILQDFEITP